MDIDGILDENGDPYIRRALAFQALMHANKHVRQPLSTEEGYNAADRPLIMATIGLILDAMKIVKSEMTALTAERAAEESQS